MLWLPSLTSLTSLDLRSYNGYYFTDLARALLSLPSLTYAYLDSNPVGSLSWTSSTPGLLYLYDPAAGSQNPLQSA